MLGLIPVSLYCITKCLYFYMHRQQESILYINYVLQIDSKIEYHKNLKKKY